MTISRNQINRAISRNRHPSETGKVERIEKGYANIHFPLYMPGITHDCNGNRIYGY